MQPEKFTDYIPDVDETRKIYTMNGLEKSKFVINNKYSQSLG